MTAWFSRKFRNAPNDQLSSSDTELGEFAAHLGDWCEGVNKDRLPWVNNPEATLVTSLQDFEFPVTSMFDTPPQNMHAPVIDLDIEHVYYESSTPGHAALLLNVQLEWDEYVELLTCLEKFGIIEEGFLKASIERGYSACRTPWTKKHPAPDLPAPSNETDVDPQTENVFDC